MKKNFDNNPHFIIRKDKMTEMEEKLSFSEGMKRLSNYYIQLDVIEKLLMTGQTLPTPYADYFLEKEPNNNNNNDNLNYNL